MVHTIDKGLSGDQCGAPPPPVWQDPIKEWLIRTCPLPVSCVVLLFSPDSLSSSSQPVTKTAHDTTVDDTAVHNMFSSSIIIEMYKYISIIAHDKCTVCYGFFKLKWLKWLILQNNGYAQVLFNLCPIHAQALASNTECIYYWPDHYRCMTKLEEIFPESQSWRHIETRL